MTKTNFHTHTYRCGHAIGNEKVMVEAAIQNNFDIVGFSCHIPLPKYRIHLLKGLFSVRGGRSFLSICKTLVSGGPAMRMPYSQKEEHQNNVRILKEKFQDKITIHQGYEAEYFKEYLPYYKKLLSTGEIEYLILGNHFNKYSIHNRYYGKPELSDQEVIQYKEDVLKALDTDLFSYIAHPDLFMIGKKHWDTLCQEVTREICIKAKEKDVPLEINGGGMRRGLRKVGEEMQYPYPNSHFFDIASEVGNKVVLGFDSHGPNQLDDKTYQLLQEFAKKRNLQVVDTFTFKKGK